MHRAFKSTLVVGVLCIYFLNSPLIIGAVAETATAPIIKGLYSPLILSDYNEGTLMTNVGGLSGGDESLPGTTFTTLIPDDNFARGNTGYSLMLSYDVSRFNEFSFYWIKLGRSVGSESGMTQTLDLGKRNYLSFWVKGAEGNEKIKIELHADTDNDGQFVFGTDASYFVYLDPYLGERKVTGAWQKALIPLKSFSSACGASKMLELVFVFENAKGNTKGAVYIDDIMFGQRPEEVLKTRAAEGPKAPDEGSFRVDGKQANLCPAFTSSNEFTIKAESVKENPFMESVRFEHSTDGGYVWRNIGADYDVSKNTYKVVWLPETHFLDYSYKVRSVVTDIWGNEAISGTLIECGIKPLSSSELLELIQSKAFRFFQEHQNMKTGLFSDTTGGGDASIASTGFALTALAVGAERGWLGRDEAGKRANLALDAFLPRENGKALVEGKDGFFYHFVDIHTGARAGSSEISTIDTAILVAGALTAGEYFGGEAQKKATKIYENVEWEKFLSKDKDGPHYNMFSMGWSPERGILEASWDFYTDEAILVSLLAIGSPTHPVSPDVFYAWARYEGSYKDGKPFIYSWHGALFSYQYAHVWFDLRKLVDKNGVNWFENSARATRANRRFCMDQSDKYKTYGPNTWGITSMARPSAYTMHFGAPPTGSGQPMQDGTISPTAAAGSIVFTPYLSFSALRHMYFNYPKLWGQYGLRDSFNLDTDWYADAYYGIGEALYILPVENFRSGFVWKTFMKNKYVKEALKRAGFKEKNP